MRRGSLLSLLALVLLASVAEARAVRVVKSTRLRKMHVYWPQYLEANKVTIIAFPADLNNGDEYDIVDGTGFVGRVRVSKAEGYDAGCPEFKLRRGTGTYLSPPARQAGGDAVAIGPVTGAIPPKTKVVMPNDQSKFPPAPQQLVDRKYVDLDGDGEIDVIRDYWYCEGGQGSTKVHTTGSCVKTVGRARPGAEWKEIESVKALNCY